VRLRYTNLLPYDVLVKNHLTCAGKTVHSMALDHAATGSVQHKFVPETSADTYDPDAWTLTMRVPAHAGLREQFVVPLYITYANRI